MLNAKEILENLVKCNTIKDKENAKILDYIENTLKSLGFVTEKKEKFLIMSNGSQPSLGFLGHTDTVEYTEGWQHEKLALTEENGNLYGLGACDMKSGIAAMIAAISQINFSTLSKGMKLYFSYDEEINFSGIKEIIDYEKEFPKTMIIGEPTNNEIMVGSKGLMEYRIALKGIKTHSSTPDKGKNAIMLAIQLIDDLTNFYENKIKPNSNENFEIPYTTMNIGKISGGSAINSVPDSCEIFVDFRTVCKEAEQEIIQKLQELKQTYQAEIDEINRISPFYNPSKLSRKTCNFITEASFLENERIILGAGPVTAHEVEEHISKLSLEQLVKQYQELIHQYCK